MSATPVEKCVIVNMQEPTKLTIEFKPAPVSTPVPVAPTAVPAAAPTKRTSSVIENEIILVKNHMQTLENCKKTSTANVNRAIEQLDAKKRESDALRKQIEELQKQLDAKSNEETDAKLKVVGELKELKFNESEIAADKKRLDDLTQEKGKVEVFEKEERVAAEKEADAQIAAFRASQKC